MIIFNYIALHFKQYVILDIAIHDNTVFGRTAVDITSHWNIGAMY